MAGSLNKKKFPDPLSCEFLIFTDGACSGNPGPGGYAAVVATKQGQVQELGGCHNETTNNRMELRATIEALRLISEQKGDVALFTDSTYVIRGITQWIWGWLKRDWKNAEGHKVLNQDLWQELLRLVKARDKGSIQWLYSRGHVGTPGNERCDKIAVAFSQNRTVSLYRGSLLQYPIAIYDLPEDTELPEIRPREEKKQAYSYLSLQGGKVVRHKDWASCERRVKGQSGAKFKKALSAENEIEILKSWGLSPGAKIED